MNKHSRFTSNGFKLAALALAISGAGSAMALDATATATTTVIAPIQISKSIDLSFGNIAAGTTQGTVTLSPNNTIAFANGPLAVSGGTAAAAKFDVSGEGSRTYAITVTGTPLTSGGDSMPFTPIADLTASAKTSGTVTAGALTGGAQSIYVGGILTVGATQAPGNYTGTITATVAYN